MEIIQERIRREYDLDVISTYPSVVYKVTKTDLERDSKCTIRCTCQTSPKSNLSKSR